MNEEEIRIKAMHAVEQDGIVFLDEIDKVCQPKRVRRGRRFPGGCAARPPADRRGSAGHDEVRRLRTDHILFIASGAFHLAKPSDLIPELQGRLPIRVELSKLDRSDDFERILTATEPSIVRQQEALLASEGVRL